MSEILTETQSINLDSPTTNSFGDRVYYSLNRGVFNKSGAYTVYQSQYTLHLNKKETFFIISGTDGGLLIDYVQSQDRQDGSRFLFIELENVIQQTGLDQRELPSNMAITSIERWKEDAESLFILNFAVNEKIHLFESQAVMLGFYSPYNAFREALRQAVYQFRWQTKVAFSYNTHRSAQISNITENSQPASVLRNSFTGKTAVLLAAGHSLDNHIEWVKQNRDKLFVAAVSRISNLLKEVDLAPDIISSNDAYSRNLLISYDMFAFQDTSILINGNSLTPELLSMWKGKNLYLDTRYPWDSESEQDNLVTTGPTVTNGLYWLLVEMGFSQVILLGTDLCFSPEGNSHTASSKEVKLGMKLIHSNQSVKTNTGNTAETTNEYLFAAQDIEKTAKIAAERGCQTFNPSGNAIKLENIQFCDIHAISIPEITEPPRDILDKLIPEPCVSNQKNHYHSCLEEVSALISEINSVEKLVKDALIFNAKMFEPNMHQKFKPRLDAIEETINRDFTRARKFIQTFGIKHFLNNKVISGDAEYSAEEIRKIGENYYQAYLTSIADVMQILQLSKSRIHCRLQEISTSPDIETLMTQWETDHQYGRGISWCENHPEIIDSASSIISKKIAVLKSSLEESLGQYQEMLYGQPSLNYQSRKRLTHIQSRAKVYLTQKDISGLQLLSNSLDQTHDGEPKNSLALLLKAYRLDLEGKIVEACEIYAQMLDTSYETDALLRLLQHQLQHELYDAAIPTLARLTESNQNYIPALADLLHQNGESTQAINLYTDYLLLMPDDLQSMFKLGRIYQNLGSDEGLEWTMQYILEKDPTNQAASNLLTSIGK